MNIHSRKGREKVLSLTRNKIGDKLKLPNDVVEEFYKFKDRGSLEDLLGGYPSALEMPLEDLESLALWINSRSSDPGPRKISDKNVRNIGHGVFVGYTKIKQGIYVSFRVESGQEIISALFNKRNLVTSTIRICGLVPSRLMQALPENKKNMHDILHSKSAIYAASVWSLNDTLNLDKEIFIAVTVLSQVLVFLQDKTRRVSFKDIEKQDCTDTNGCTGVPDFNFEDCCNEHDRCYCIGCTEQDRLVCDVAMYNCIKEEAMDWLAWVYYQGVRNLGGPHFNFCTGGESILVAEDEEPVGADRCFVSVILIRVRHKSGDVGNDWSYKVGVDGISTYFDQHTLNAGGIKSWGQPLYSKERGRCGNSISLELFAEAREHDVGPDDTGGGYETVHIECPGVYRKTLDVSISEWGEDTSTLEFLFEIRAFCVQ